MPPLGRWLRVREGGRIGLGSQEHGFDLRERGPTDVRLVIADHHSGLVEAVRKVMLGAACQRCRVHFLCNVFAVISKDCGEMVAATIRTIFSRSAGTRSRTARSHCCRP